jgi:hypothetical protein
MPGRRHCDRWLPSVGDTIHTTGAVVSAAAVAISFRANVLGIINKLSHTLTNTHINTNFRIEFSFRFLVG